MNEYAEPGNEPLLQAAGLTRRFGGLVAVDAVALDVKPGETVSIIGPNGAGKTTLFNLISGLDAPDGGTIHFDGQLISGLRPTAIAQLGIARTFQHGRVFANLSVLDNVLVGAHTQLKAARPRWGVFGPLAELAVALLRPPKVAAEEARLRERALETLALFGDRLLPRSAQPAHSLSYANRRRLELARALALRPRLLLLDEPTAGMNPFETDEMLEVIRALKTPDRAILLIEHKLELVMELSDRVVVLDGGRTIAHGSPQAVRDDPRVIDAYLGRDRRAELLEARQAQVEVA